MKFNSANNIPYNFFALSFQHPLKKASSEFINKKVS